MVHFDKQVPPIIGRQPEGYTAHFRDPQVWRDADGSYRMLLGVQRENLTGAALLYRSADLRAWECEGEMTFPDARWSLRGVRLHVGVPQPGASRRRGFG